MTTVGIPLEGIALIIAVDRLLDMLRSVINLWSNVCGSVIIAQILPTQRY